MKKEEREKSWVIIDLLKVKGMTTCLVPMTAWKKVECESIENFGKKNWSMFGLRENARKKNKREKVE